ncbi:MAG: hypothetical protein ACJ8GW_01430 [Massilia sp.]
MWKDSAPPAWSQPVLAVVDRHILLSGATVRQRAGAMPRQLAAGTLVTPLVHVEIDPLQPVPNLHAASPQIIKAMQSAAAATTSGWVQLDLEARPSQRVDYRTLVQDLRRVLPPSVQLSVTALAWWCRSPAWLDGLAADEVVPMFFKMGREGAALRKVIAQQPSLLHPSCRTGSAGFSPQEPFAPAVVARYTHTYWFDYHGWTTAP